MKFACRYCQKEYDFAAQMGQKMICIQCGKSFAVEPLPIPKNPPQNEVRDTIWYLRSIRKILLFFFWLTVISIILDLIRSCAS